MRNFIFVCLIFSVFSPVLASVPHNRCGSEGPHPFMDLSGSVKSVPKVVATKSAVQEFLHSNYYQGFVYRDTRSRLWAQNGPTVDGDLYLGRLSHPLSSVTDDSGRFVTTDDSNWFLNLGTGSFWTKIFARDQDRQPLFWQGRFQYSVHREETATGPNFRFYRYFAGLPVANPVCNITTTHQGYYLGEGHTYPNVIMYETRSTATGRMLAVQSVNLLTCQVSVVVSYGADLPGEVRQVSYFDALKSYAIEVDHPVKNLLWDTPQGCRYYNVGGGRAVFPDFDYPYLTIWTPANGVYLMQLNARQSLQLLKGGETGPFERSHTWFDPKSKQLYLAPELDGNGGRAILEFSLGKFLP